MYLLSKFLYPRQAQGHGREAVREVWGSGGALGGYPGDDQNAHSRSSKFVA